MKTETGEKSGMSFYMILGVLMVAIGLGAVAAVVVTSMSNAQERTPSQEAITQQDSAPTDPDRPAIAPTTTAQPEQTNGILKSGETQTMNFAVDSADTVTFYLLWFDAESKLNFNLIDPLGVEITPQSVFGYSTGSAFMPGGGFGTSGSSYIISKPTAGTWQAVVKVEKAGPDGEGFFVDTQFEGGIQFDIEAAPDLVGTGDLVTISVRLSDGKPIKGARISAGAFNMSDIKGSSAYIKLDLSEEEDGVYKGTFAPQVAGDYTISADVSGQNSRGEPFNRTQTAIVTVNSGASLAGGERTNASSSLVFKEEAYWSPIENEKDNPQGSSSDYVDGKYNLLVISVTAVIREGGTYRMTADLATAGGASVARANTGEIELQPGTVEIPLEFHGRELGYMADGPYQLVSLLFTQLSGSETTVAMIHEPMYTTQAYSRYDWPRKNAILLAGVTEQGIDTNGNGLYEYLEITIPVDVLEEGAYYASGYLEPKFLDADFFHPSTTGEAIPLKQGRNELVLRFDGTMISASGKDGPYKVTELSITGAIGGWSDYGMYTVIETRPYKSTDFER